MTNRITFTVETDGFYSEGEKVDLLDAFSSWFANVDDDMVEDSEKLDFTDPNSVSGVTDVQRKEIIDDFLKNALVSVSIDGVEVVSSDS